MNVISNLLHFYRDRKILEFTCHTAFLPQLLLSNGLIWSFAKLENYLYSNKEWAIGLWISDFVSKQVRNMAQLCNLTNFLLEKKNSIIFRIFFVKLHKPEGIFFVATIFFSWNHKYYSTFPPYSFGLCSVLYSWHGQRFEDVPLENQLVVASYSIFYLDLVS